MLKRNIILGILLGSASLSAAAEKDITAELLLGSSNQELSFPGESVSGDALSIGVRGSILLHENVAAEASYQTYGEGSENKYGNKFKFNTTALNVGVKGILPLENGVSLNGRLGASFTNTDVKISGSGSEDFDDTSFYYGVGAQYDLNENIIIGAEYTLYNTNGKIEGTKVDMDFNNLALTIGYTF